MRIAGPLLLSRQFWRRDSGRAMETSASSPTLCMPETPQVDGGDPERGDSGRNSLASGECIVMRKRASSPFSNQGLSHRRHSWCTVNYRSGVNSCDVTQYPIVLCVRQCYTATTAVWCRLVPVLFRLFLCLQLLTVPQSPTV